MSKSFSRMDLDRFDHRRKAAVKRAKRQEHEQRNRRKSGRWDMIAMEDSFHASRG